LDLFDQKKENKSLTSLIFDKIREDILNDKYVAGDKIVEAKLAEELGVSRTPVREALKQLELDGLVDNIPNRGVVVKGISNQDIHDIYTIRVAIEGIAARWAVERMDDEDQSVIEDLKEIYDLMEFYTFKNDTDKFFDLDTKFHETIYLASKSRYLEQVLRDFQLFIKTTRAKSLLCEGRPGHALEEHKAILEGFIEKNADKAYEATVKHIEGSRKNAQSFNNR